MLLFIHYISLQRVTRLTAMTTSYAVVNVILARLVVMLLMDYDFYW